MSPGSPGGASSGVYREPHASPAPQLVAFRAVGFLGGRPSPFFSLLGAASLGLVALGPSASWLAGAIANRTMIFLTLPLAAMSWWYFVLLCRCLRVLTFDGSRGVLLGLTRRTLIRSVVVGRSRVAVETDLGSESIWLAGGPSAREKLARAALAAADSSTPAAWDSNGPAPPSATWSAGGSALGWLIAAACGVVWLIFFSRRDLAPGWFSDSSPLNDLYNTLTGSIRPASQMWWVAGGIGGAPILFVLLSSIFSRVGRPLDQSRTRLLIVACEAAAEASPSAQSGLWRSWSPRDGLLLAAPLVLLLASALFYFALVIPPLVNFLVLGAAFCSFASCVRRLRTARIIQSTSHGVRVRVDAKWHAVDDCDSSGDVLVLLLGRVPIRMAYPRLTRAGTDRTDEMAGLCCYLKQRISTCRGRQVTHRAEGVVGRPG